MREDRFAQRLAQFRDALAALKLALEQPEDEFMRDSIIKRFELSFETARKAMRQWLVDQEELTYESTKKAVMEAAFKTALVSDADLWAATIRRTSTTRPRRWKSWVSCAPVRWRRLRPCWPLWRLADGGADTAAKAG